VLIQFDRVSKRYPGGRQALKDLSLSIPRGEMVFLTGHSGAGKSTLLKLLPLIERPSGGRLLLGGQDLSRLPRRRLPQWRRRFGLIFQDHRLLADRNAYDNVRLPLEIAGFDPREADRRACAALDKVGLLGLRAAMPDSLSAGEQQRVGIARAVAHRPDILLADEPTGNLDPELSLEIMRLFAAFHAVGVTVLIATHDIHLLGQFDCPRVEIAAGEVVRCDLPA